MVEVNGRTAGWSLVVVSSLSPDTVVCTSRQLRLQGRGGV